MTGAAGGPAPAPARTILHVDMDAFFAEVELARRPELRGRPVVVGGEGARGVVAAASYEARRFGVHSAMPSVRARRLCPQAVFLPGDHAHYAAVSRRVHEVFQAVTPLVEPISLDEAFLDVTAARRLFGSGHDIAVRIRTRVAEDVGLPCSVGVAPTKLVAKLASEAAKPTASPAGVVAGPGVVVVEPDRALAFLQGHPVQALWGVGPATLERLRRFGVRTVGDLAALPVETLVGALGPAAGRHLAALARGEDERAVEPDRATKSIGHEETFAADRFSHDELHADLVRLVDGVGTRLRAHGLAGRTVTVKVRWASFRTTTRSVTLAEPVDGGPALAAAAEGLLRAVDVAPGVRLLGVSVSQLTDQPVQQLSLALDGPGPDEPTGAPDGGWRGATRAVDEIRARFGAAAIGPATLATGPGDGLRVLRPGAQQWGPDQAREAPAAPPDDRGAE